MEIKAISKEEMDARQFLAKTNMDIGVAKGILIKLQEGETEFLLQREKKAVAIVDKVLLDSKNLLEEAHKNYLDVNELCAEASGFANYLIEAHDSFKGLVSAFNTKVEVWEAWAKEREESYMQIRQQIKTDQIKLQADREALKGREDKVILDRKRIEDDRAEIERAINRLKENRI